MAINININKLGTEMDACCDPCGSGSTTITKTYVINSAKNAYELALENGFIGSIEEWLESLKGDKPVVTIGSNGNWFIDGVDSGESSKGAQGDSFEFSDLTPGELDILKQPGIDAAVDAVDNKIQFVTQAEYDALGNEKLSNGVIYYIASE